MWGGDITGHEAMGLGWPAICPQFLDLCTQSTSVARNEMAIKQSNLQQRRLLQILADPKSMQNGSRHYFFSYLTDFDVVMRELISE